MNFFVSIRDAATPKARKMIDSFTPAGLVRLHQRVGHRLVNLVRDYFLLLQGTRHATSERLGAQPTNYWGKAAESVAQPENMSADQDAAHVLIAAPGISRALGDIDIYPGEGKQYLTIPIAAESYGNRILMGEDTPRFEHGFFFTSKKGNLIYAQKQGKGKDAVIHPLYLLLPSVHQSQDRTLLPSDDAITGATQEVLQDTFKELASDVSGQIAERSA